eukprot:scaffold265518_cov33-Tisochrysis_lutea.AAC.1
MTLSNSCAVGDPKAAKLSVLSHWTSWTGLSSWNDLDMCSAHNALVQSLQWHEAIVAVCHGMKHHHAHDLVEVPLVWREQPHELAQCRRNIS